jgi:alkylation response protein AidB-like acyl-CoA dehydrogenase
MAASAPVILRGMAHDPSYEQSKQVAEAGREDEWKLPSFGKQLFLGHLDLGLIHPQPQPEPADVEKGEAFLVTFRAFLAEHVDGARIERENRVPAEVLEGLKRIGALGMKIPEEYGGLGLSQLYYARALQLAGVWHSSIATVLSAHQSIGLPQPLRMFGSEEQRREWLPKLARDHFSAFLLTEPDAGSDPARMHTVAVPTEDGTGYRINGRKLWATNGTIADVVVVMAMVPKSEARRGGITAFIVPYDSEGITIEARNEFMGLRGIDNALTRFEDVFVPAANVIGREGLGLKIALATLNTGRLSLPAMSAGAARYALKVSREFAAERTQWGKPVGKHDAVAQKIAFVAGSAFGLEAISDVSSRLADDKRNDIRIEAALAKLYGSELGWLVADAMVQVRGGRGYETAESLKARGEKPVPAEQMLRDLRINRVFEGSSEIMRLLIAREAVDQHLKAAGGLLDAKASAGEKAKGAAQAGAFYATWFPRLLTGSGQSPVAYREFGSLAGDLRYVERASRRLARATFYSIARFQAGLERKGHHLGRLVDIGAELFAISSACVYAHRIATEQPERREEAYELAGLFAKQARRRAELLFDELFDNDDTAAYKTAQRVLEGRFEWLEEGLLDPAGDGPLFGMVPEQHETASIA